METQTRHKIKLKVKQNYKTGDLIKVISPLVRCFENVSCGDIGVIMKKTPHEWGTYNVLFPDGKVIMMLVEEIRQIKSH